MLVGVSRNTAWGITFGEITTEKIRISIRNIGLTYRKSDDMFGVLGDGYIMVKGVLRRAILYDEKAQPAGADAPRLSNTFRVLSPLPNNLWCRCPGAASCKVSYQAPPILHRIPSRGHCSVATYSA